MPGLHGLRARPAQQLPRHGPLPDGPDHQAVQLLRHHRTVKDLPLDREKALAAIANGWGRTATAAHPLCRCSDPLQWPTSVPPCRRCGAEQGERCRQPGPVCGRSSSARYHRRVREHMAQFACPMHA